MLDQAETHDQGPSATVPQRKRTSAIGMQILETKVFEGPNLWTYWPIVQIRLDATAAGVDGASRLHAAMSQSGLGSTNPASGLWRDVGTIVEAIAFEIQEFAGEEVAFSASVPTGVAGIYDVVLEHKQPALTIAVLELTVHMLNCMLFPIDPEFDFQKEFDRRVMRIIAGRTMHPQEEAIFRAARERRIPIRWVSPPSLLIELGTGIFLRRYREMITSMSSHLGDSLSGNKAMTLRLLGEVGLPVPRSVTVRTPEDALAAAESIGYPVVVKPVNGMQGRGIGVDLRTPEKVREFFEIAVNATRSKTALVEQCIVGREHRILVIGGRVVAVAERMPAHVTGDGEHTVAELIAIKNTEPLRGKGHTKILSSIVIDAATLDALERVGMTPESVPSPGEHVNVKLASNMSQGGTSHDRTDEIHPENARIASLAARTLGIDPCGVDLITPDISRSVWDVGGAIIEVNYEPGTRLHLVPQSGNSRDTGAAIVESLLPLNTLVRVPVVAVAGSNGAASIAQLIASAIAASGPVVGLTTTSINTIGADVMERPDLPGRTHHQLVLRNPYVEFAVLQVEPRDFDAPGLGFEHCDVVVLTEPIQLERSRLRTAEEVLLGLNGDEGTAVIDAAHPDFDRLRSLIPASSVVFSASAADERLRAWVEAGGRGIAISNGRVVQIDGEGERLLTAINLNHSQSPIHILAAIACAVTLGVPSETIRTSLDL